MSVQLGAVCYENLYDATLGYARGLSGSTIVHGGEAYSIESVYVADGYVENIYRPLFGGPNITVALNVPWAQSCVLPGVEEGVAVGWMVASAFIAVFAIKFIVRALRGETGGTYGAA